MSDALSSSDGDDYDPEVEKSMYYTVESGDSAHLQSLMSQGYNPNYKFEGQNQLDKTVLHLACEKGHEDCAKVLLAAGAEINAQDAWYQTPLMYAACTERENMVRLLLQHGAHMAVRDRFTRSALHYAVMNETQDCLQTLLDAGADVNISDELGRTPLFNVMTTDGNVKVVKILLAHNASVNVVERREMMAMLSLCILRTREDTLKYVSLVLQAGANPDIPDKRNVYPIHCAASRGNLAVTQLLVWANAKVTCWAEMNFSPVEGTHQVTPFHCAVLFNHDDVARLLLQAGSEVWEDHLSTPSPWTQTMHLHLYERVKELLAAVLSQPRTLYLIVRLYLRKRLAQPFWPKVNRLPLPTQLKLSLRLPELTSIVLSS